MVARARIVGMAVLAVMGSVVVPTANADPASGCLQSSPPGCGQQAFVTDLSAAGITGTSGRRIEVSEGQDLCSLMNQGFGRDQITGDFVRLHPELSPAEATQVVDFAVRDLCPWNH